MELTYFPGKAETYPRPSIDNPGYDRPLEGETVPYVDEAGQVLGRMSRTYAHGGSRPLHPVVHMHLVDRQGRIYLQKRSASKDLYSHKWDTSVGGHVDFGESIMDALYREAEEELGLVRFNPVALDTYVFESRRERELVSVFACVGNFVPVPNPEEIEKGKWWSVEEVENNLGKSVFTPNFESEFKRIKDILLSLL